MKPSMNKRKSNCLAGALALLLMAGLAMPLRAQSGEAAQAAATEQKADAAGGKPEAAEAKPEAKKAEAEDASKRFLQSPVVAWVGKLVGLDAEKMSLTAILINFLILAAILFFALRKALPAMFLNRTATIQQAMEDARKASAEANQRLADIESRLSNLGKEVEQMGAQAEQGVAHEEQRLQAAAEEDLKKIVSSAEQEIVAFGQAARRELTAHAADLAVTLAKQRINVDGATDQSLVSSFAANVAQTAQSLTGGSGGKGGQ